MIPDLLNKNYLGCKGKWFQSYDNKYPLFQGLKRGKIGRETGHKRQVETVQKKPACTGTRAWEHRHN